MDETRQQKKRTKPTCPYCKQPVDTRKEYARVTSPQVPKQWGNGTYHLDHFWIVMGRPDLVGEDV